MKAIRLHVHGGPEVLRFEEVPEPTPQAGEVLVRIKAAGVNFIDTYQRAGLYPVTLPYTPGSEGVGEVVRDAGGFKAGQRVLWVAHAGSYAEVAAIPAAKLVAVPENLDDAAAVAAGLQAMTAQFLAESIGGVAAGDSALVHAGAGGVGLLLIQLLKARGVRVFTTVSTPEKAALARAVGADEAILYTQDDFVAAVKAATGGKGVKVAYDSVGKTTALGSLSLVQPLGTLVLYGQSSGVVPPIDPLALMRQGSIFLTRPTLFHYIAEPGSLQQRAARVFDLVREGKLKLRVGHEFALADAAQAHTELEARRTTGKIVLKVG